MEIKEKLVKNFEEWMNNNTSLLPRSKSQYLKIIKMFLRSYDGITIDNINKFLREKHGHFYRFAFRYFFMFLEREKNYSSIVKIRRMPRKRHGVYAKKERLKDLIYQISKDNFRIVALIQYYTGARPHDVLGMRKEDFRVEEVEGSGLTLHLIMKAMVEHTAEIPFPEAKEIIEFVKKSHKEYPFLIGKSKDFTRWINNNYRYYYKEIRIASEMIGLKGFRPHDFRRNLANDVYKGTKDIYLTKEILGHKRIETTVRYLEGLKKKEEIRKAIERFRR